ncbi:hypothetical protein CEXT_556001 [Caerostris extrusa]|uniref:Uncharacterized protein n=1 Tax=Caerostris extrusa TaxID=172846 RepID=A0AAV4TGN0_CAEEX|nr:hypothetical protein CEXT_556001 [Caerostris extrusa]
MHQLVGLVSESSFRILVFHVVWVEQDFNGGAEAPEFIIRRRVIRVGKGSSRAFLETSSYFEKKITNFDAEGEKILLLSKQSLLQSFLIKVLSF